MFNTENELDWLGRSWQSFDLEVRCMECLYSGVVGASWVVACSAVNLSTSLIIFMVVVDYLFVWTGHSIHRWTWHWCGWTWVPPKWVAPWSFRWQFLPQCTCTCDVGECTWYQKEGKDLPSTSSGFWCHHCYFPCYRWIPSGGPYPQPNGTFCRMSTAVTK